MAIIDDDALSLSDLDQEESGFFDAKLIDGKYTPSYIAKQFADYFSLFVGNGVFMSPADQLMVKQVPDEQSLAVILEPGWAFINGQWYHNKRRRVLTAERNDSMSTRNDGVFIQYDIVNDTIKAVYETGRTTPQRTDTMYELLVAQIALPQSSSQITDSIITDKRGDSSVCGFVKGLVEVVDLEVILTQINSIFEDFMELSESEFTKLKSDYNNWFEETKQKSDEWFESKNKDYEQWKQSKDTEFVEYIAAKDLQFNEWFDTIKGILDGDTAGNLAREIVELKGQVQQINVDVEQVKQDNESIKSDISEIKDVKADKSVLLNATVLSSLWSGEEAPYTAVLPVEQVTGNNNELLEVFLPDTNTTEQVTAWAESGILTAINTVGSIIFKAYYDKPTVDIPIYILAKGDLGSKYPGGDGGGTATEIERITEQEVKNLFLDQNKEQEIKEEEMEEW